VKNKAVWIVDFGSQYTQLITRRSREIGHSSEIITYNTLLKRWKNNERPKALVLSGGPQSIFKDPRDYNFIFKDNPVATLGICYGMQIMGHALGGKVEKGTSGEYGLSQINFADGMNQFNLKGSFNSWMSHFDHVSDVPPNFKVMLNSENGFIAGICHEEKPFWGLQFHPEVEHTEQGRDILNAFFSQVGKMEKDWGDSEMMDEALEVIKKEEGAQVLCAFSGGVDSLVAATLCEKISPENLHCFFVDHGLLRPQDIHHIKVLQEKTKLNIQIVDVKDQFFSKLKGISEPEAKRKIIGHEFITVFEQKVHEYEVGHGVKFTHLLQGTLYPDVIESVSPHGEEGISSTIKSHHNVGGLPERMKLKLLEPLRYLFKDEVRKLGEALGLNYDWVHRHPFPGPGIGVRVLGELTPTRVEQVGKSDQILFEELKAHDLYQATWQALTVLLPVKTVGVKGDERAYEEVICLRMVDSSDGMTATYSKLPFDFFSTVSRRITNEVAGITRVVYDITDKPPGTIEWE
jgi:GMP synthase (glutamine-hydrolysing)